MNDWRPLVTHNPCSKEKYHNTLNATVDVTQNKHPSHCSKGYLRSEGPTSEGKTMCSQRVHSSKSSNPLRHQWFEPPSYQLFCYDDLPWFSPVCVVLIYWSCLGQHCIFPRTTATIAMDESKFSRLSLLISFFFTHEPTLPQCEWRPPHPHI